jgi:hypothetical protein
MRQWCMIDIESLGTHQQTPVLSLGAVSYNFETGITASFHEFFEVDEQLKKGRYPQWKTIQWWMDQGDSARGRMSLSRSGLLNIEEMTDEFWTWWNEKVGDAPREDGAFYSQLPLVISKGAAFDVPILEGLLEQVPWDYRNVRCYRSMLGWFAPNEKRNPVAHDALADATDQALVHLNLMASHENLR